MVYARSWTHRQHRTSDGDTDRTTSRLALVVEEAGHHVPRHPVRVTLAEKDDAVDVEAMAVPTAVFADEDGAARDCGCQDEMASLRAPLEQIFCGGELSDEMEVRAP